jgi:hypothetical protein
MKPTITKLTLPRVVEYPAIHSQRCEDMVALLLQWETERYSVYMGHDIIHEDRDFFSYIPPEDFDLIIDNPPFSCFKEVCSRLKLIDKPFIIIARSNLLLCRWFQRLFCNSLQVIIPDKRITFTHLTNPKKGYNATLRLFLLLLQDGI